MPDLDPLHFDRDPAAYRDARPGYPPELIQQLVGWGLLGAGSRVLEIGPGTGQATRMLLDAGAAAVTAIELGGAMAATLRAELPDPRLTVLHADAATVELAPEAFDLVVAATSFHWLAASAVLPRLAAALRPGGGIAVWWNVFGDPAETTPFRSGLGRLIGTPAAPASHEPAPLRTADRIAELTDGGWFTDPRSATWRWPQRLTTAEAVTLFGTFSHFADRPDVLAAIPRLVDELGGAIEETWLTALYAARRA